MGWIQKKLETGEYFTCRDIYKQLGFTHVMGVATNGETAIAGPITVVATVLPHTHRIRNLKPYSDLSHEQCLKVNKKVRAKCIHINIGWASPSILYRAGKTAALEAAFGVALGRVNRYNPMSVIIIDGPYLDFLFKNLEGEGTPIICHRGCSSYFDTSIAASIIAKVARETIMSAFWHKQYPEYGWDTNFGYATKPHIEAIKEYGITPLHRDLSHVKSIQDIPLKANIKRR